MPLHGHPYRQANQNSIQNDASGGAIMTDSNATHANRSAFTGSPANANTKVIGGTGSGGSHNHGSMSVMQPYMALKFMIKT